MSDYRVTITTKSGEEVYSEHVESEDDYQAVFAAALEFRRTNADKLDRLFPGRGDVMADLIVIGAFRELKINVEFL